MNKRKILGSLFLICTITFSSFSQLGFCDGDKGEPIFTETFGAGNSQIDPTAIGTTAYTFVRNITPVNAEYTIIDPNFAWRFAWFRTNDHTVGDVSGNALVVNADENSVGIFFERQILGLCPQTTYEFSAWLLNMSSLPLSGFCTTQTGIQGGIPINVRFEIWDETNTTVLKSGSTGELLAQANPIWERYGLTFQTAPGQESVYLKIFNNGQGGCGNDLALDDIEFASCGDNTVLSSSLVQASPVTYCDDSPGVVILEVVPDFSVFSSHFYQWQTSNDGVSFFDIPGANNAVYNTQNLNSSGDYYYRVKIAETSGNLANDFCNSITENFVIQIRDKVATPILGSTTEFCETDDISLSVNPISGLEVKWYDASNTILSNSSTYTIGKLPVGNYEFFVEANYADFDCPSDRLPVSIDVFGNPNTLNPQVLFTCPGEPINISSSELNATYLWNTGATSRGIEIAEPGNYSVEIVNGNGCSGKEYFELQLKTQPAKIKEVISNEDTIRIIPQSQGSYEYSLDGINFQTSNVFNDLITGRYTAFIRENTLCESEDSKSFFHLNIFKVFTPNFDGINDEFIVNGVKSVEIFNRFGRLIVQGKGGISWDGTQNGERLSTNTYWYLVKTEEGQLYTGHFLLKR